MTQRYDSNRIPAQQQTHSKKPWFAAAHGITAHDVVGIHVPPPKPADPTRHALQPFAVWMWMLDKSGHDDRPHKVMGTVITLRRGQIALAERQLAKLANWGRTFAKNFLAKLEMHGMIQIATPSEAARTQKGQLGLNLDDKKTCHPLSIITLCNYDDYQFSVGGRRARHVPDANQESTRDKRQEDSIGPVGTTESCTEQIGSIASRTDGAPGDRLPFSDQALAACEQMGFTREAIVARYYERTARRRTPVRDPSAYLIAIAVDLAAKARGCTADDVRRSVSKDPEQRQAGQAQVTGAAREPSHECLERVRRRCETRGLMVTALVAAWQQRTRGTTVLKPDANLEAFAQWWIDKQRGAA
jgi:hypothetical protein